MGLIVLLTLAPALGKGLLAGSGGVDAMGSYWFQWWLREAQPGGASLQHTDLLFFPWGKDILAHTGANLVDAGLAALLGHLLGPAGAWNALYALILISNAFAAALLGGTSPKGRAGAFLVGLLHPYALWELAEGRPAQALLAPLIAALALTEQACEPGTSPRRALGAGLCLGLAGLVYWYGGLFGGIAILLLVLSRRAFRVLAPMALAAGLVVAPLAVPLVGAIAAGGVPGLLGVGAWLAGGRSLVDTAGETHQLCVLAGPCEAAFLSATGSRPLGAALGLLSLPLALLAARWRGRRWLAVGLVALLLAVGPWPMGQANPLYLGLAALLPPVARLYWPCRALALLVPLGAAGAGAWIERRAAPGRALLLLGAALLLDGAVQGRWPLGAWDPSVEAAWACLPPDSGAVISLPYGIDHRPLLAQTLHGNPLLGGMNERSQAQAPAAQQALRRDNAWLRALLAAPADPRDQGAGTDAERAAVGALGFRWVVLRWAAAPAAHDRIQRSAVERRMAFLAGRPRLSTPDLSIYAPWGGPALTCPAAMAGPGAER